MVTYVNVCQTLKRSTNGQWDKTKPPQKVWRLGLGLDGAGVTKLHGLSEQGRLHRDQVTKRAHSLTLFN